MIDKYRFLKYPAFLACFVNLLPGTGGGSGENEDPPGDENEDPPGDENEDPGDGRCPAVDPLNYTVLLPNPEDCSSFFSCSNGVPILMHCPDGLHFNDKLDVCDWPQDAGCEDGKYCCVDSALCSLISAVLYYGILFKFWLPSVD